MHPCTCVFCVFFFFIGGAENAYYVHLLCWVLFVHISALVFFIHLRFLILSGPGTSLGQWHLSQSLLAGCFDLLRLGGHLLNHLLPHSLSLTLFVWKPYFSFAESGRKALDIPMASCFIKTNPADPLSADLYQIGLWGVVLIVSALLKTLLLAGPQFHM